MVKFIEEKNINVFPFTALYDYMNTYKTKKGKRHKTSGVSQQQLGALLSQHPLFNKVEDGIWEYTGED